MEEKKQVRGRSKTVQDDAHNVTNGLQEIVIQSRHKLLYLYIYQPLPLVTRVWEFYFVQNKNYTC